MHIRPTQHHGRWAIASACAGVLLLAGCSSTNDTSAAPSTNSSSTVSSSSAETGQKVTIADAWVKATAGTEEPSMTAAFGVLTNHTDNDLTIVSAANGVTDRTELHEMAMVDGAMVMRPISGGIPIPANGTTTLEPGGMHVMIMDAKAPIAPGDAVKVTLTLNDGTSMVFATTAKEFAGANEAHHGESSDMMDMSSTGAMDMESPTAESNHEESGAGRWCHNVPGAAA